MARHKRTGAHKSGDPRKNSKPMYYKGFGAHGTHVGVFSKNSNGSRTDEAMEHLEERRRRFYEDDVADNAYVVALSSLPGPFSTAFFEVKDKNDMFDVIYDVLGEVRGKAIMELNKEQSVVERIYSSTNQTTSAFLLDDYEDWPRINYGTGAQFKFSRQHGVIDGTHTPTYVWAS